MCKAAGTGPLFSALDLVMIVNCTDRMVKIVTYSYQSKGIGMTISLESQGGRVNTLLTVNKFPQMYQEESIMGGGGGSLDSALVL